ncbi:hypothetical protein MsAg5_13380 [Methanosarcinaceae archaeon Ag5]|uniref:Abi family protein n=1 Tax=Methanolapillus africanus TaxID=3028297 RepID=A0AAE4MJ69_9EURY|nr:hypothetical protein [Methanosarcinaceae archaeon Ag5]
MNNNLPLSVDNQTILLMNRGLIIRDQTYVENFLLNNTFYRLKNYTRPFQDNSLEGHPFVNNTCFEDVLDVYNFDIDLRSLIFKATEKIEIAFRTQLIQHYSLAYGAHWYLDEKHFRSQSSYTIFLADFFNTLQRSTEDFIEPYKMKSGSTCWMVPACWISFEIISLGKLSKLFTNLYQSDSCKKKIADHFKIKSPLVLENWIYCISVVRNICAHHGRLWNRTIPMDIEFLKKTCSGSFIQNLNIPSNKIYAYICAIQYLLNAIDPENDFKIGLFDLFEKNPSINLSEMGFPIDWRSEAFWM